LWSGTPWWLDHNVRDLSEKLNTMFCRSRSSDIDDRADPHDNPKGRYDADRSADRWIEHQASKSQYRPDNRTHHRMRSSPTLTHRAMVHHTPASVG